MRRPQPHPFLGASHGPPAGAEVLVVGLPFDGGASFRAGAAGGPAGIRRFSASIESYSPRARGDLEDLRVVDAGDFARPPSPAAAARLFQPGRLVVALGGDHSVTPPLVRGAAARFPGLVVVGFDAHLDLRDRYPGEHACTFRRVAEAGLRCVLLGPRSGCRREWADAPALLEHHSPDLVLPPAVRRRVGGAPVYVTVDVDVLDPSVAPGTGNPEPGGPGFRELVEGLGSLRGLRVVGVDVVEVAPPLDPSGVTQVVGAVLVREAILLFAPQAAATRPAGPAGRGARTPRGSGGGRGGRARRRG